MTDKPHINASMAGTFGVVAMMNEAPQQTKEFINYHLNLGASYLVLSFDNPEDPAIAEYEFDSRVICVPCTPSHWKNLIGRQPEALAEKLSACKRFGHQELLRRGVEWTLMIDADELLFAPTDLCLILQAIPAYVDLIKVRPLESVQHQGMKKEISFASRYFKPLHRSPTILTQIGAMLIYAGVRDVVRFGYFPHANCWAFGFFGHIEGRCFVRCTTEVAEYRSHTVMLKTSRSAYGRRRIKLNNLSILHFDCVSYDSWYLKWKRRGAGWKKARSVKIGNKRIHQEVRLRSAIERGDKEFRRLFRKWQWWSPLQVSLGLRMGLLKEITIPDKMFFNASRPSITSAEVADL